MKAILVNKQIITDRDILYSFALEQEPVVVPGQFVEVEVNRKTVPFLRRAISVFDMEGNILKLFIRSVGDGTKEISDWECGHETDILVPLGNGFLWQKEEGNALLIGGGIGVAPMFYLAKEMIKAGKKVTLLFTPVRDAKMLDAFKDLEDKVDIITAENRSNLPEVLQKALADGRGADGIYVCGPNLMMKSVSETCEQNGMPLQVSMECSMGCGYGICAGCVIPIKKENGITYKKACMDGPVFNGSEVVFDV